MLYEEGQASDHATFITDLLEEGHGWHLTKGRQFLCRRNGPRWENALVYQITNYPQREIINEDSEVSAVSTILWIEPDMWKPHNLAPNQPQKEGYMMFSAMCAFTRFGFDIDDKERDRLWAELIEHCTGKTHSQVLEELRD
jgi:hypothetical protein